MLTKRLDYFVDALFENYTKTSFYYSCTSLEFKKSNSGHVLLHDADSKMVKGMKHDHFEMNKETAGIILGRGHLLVY
ncbi:uncharacterized protein VTP21DRAFT_941 [Calcarisporiella thermophila]|uniref:uncharacterized protein n=1 Tax=Calcarisporiella thermophila TaxID=911321 RepID=UPI003742C48E